MLSPDPKQACEFLRSLKLGGMDRTAFTFLTEGLRHRREGVQVCAGQILGLWGGREAVEPLRLWLEEALHRRSGWATAGQAAIALSRCVTDEDAPWVLDLYFGKTTRNQKSYLRPLVIALPAHALAARVEQEARSPKPLSREAAAHVLRKLDLPFREELLLVLSRDHAPRVRELAASCR